MSLCVVVGGQYGSEGKGKIAAVIAQRDDIDIAIRCGGPNSGHSFVIDNDVLLVREIPTAFINPKTRLLIPAGATVDLDILRFEIDSLGIPIHRVGVDRNAMIIEDVDKETERALQLGRRLSSTLCGVGAAAARRLMRGENVRLAGDAARTEPWLARILTDVSKESNDALDCGRRVLIEGTQGFGLSLFHSGHYPKTTSKDTSAAAFLSEAGISPTRVTDIVLVMRTFPIRVAGSQAGPLSHEISWEQLEAESGSPLSLSELTTVTGRLRRVARFDWSLAKRAVQVNGPTAIAINCIDHVSFKNRGIRSYTDLTKNAQDFITRLELDLRTPVRFIGSSPSLKDVFERRRRADQPVRELVS